MGALKDMLLKTAAENCEICNAPLADLQKGDNWQDHLDVCSEECKRELDGKEWPQCDDCGGCPSHKDGPHKLSCTIGGAQQIKIPMKSKK